MSDYVKVTCATSGCGYSPFPMDAGFNQRARRTHESFYCPAGHSNYYAGMSDLDRLRRDLDLEKRNAAFWEERAHHWSREARKCPWPTCRDYVYASKASMYEHMRRAHDMPVVVLVAEAS